MREMFCSSFFMTWIGIYHRCQSDIDLAVDIVLYTCQITWRLLHLAVNNSGLSSSCAAVARIPANIRDRMCLAYKRFLFNISDVFSIISCYVFIAININSWDFLVLWRTVVVDIVLCSKQSDETTPPLNVKGISLKR